MVPVSQINRVERLIINLDTCMPMVCAWAECDKRARTPYQVRVHEHARSIKCSELELYGGRHAHYAFCSDSHRDYWVASTGTSALELADRYDGRIWGMHSAGNRRMNR